jgi:hypothetical protein
LVRVSGRSRTCGAGGTSWNIPACPQTATADEAQQAVQVAERLISAADTLLGQLSFFVQPERPEP